MGARGPSPKPVELKVLEGNRGNRPLDLSAIFRPEVGLPSPPKYLSAAGRKAWKRLTPELVRYNLLSTVDQDALGMLCQSIGRVELIETAIAKKMRGLDDPVDALFDTTPNGLRIQSAIYQVLNKEQDKVWRMLDAFGLKPDARAAVTKALAAQLQLFEGGGNGGGDKPPGPAPEGFAAFR